MSREGVLLRNIWRFEFTDLELGETRTNLVVSMPNLTNKKLTAEVGVYYAHCLDIKPSIMRFTCDLMVGGLDSHQAQVFFFFLVKLPVII